MLTFEHFLSTFRVFNKEIWRKTTPLWQPISPMRTLYILRNQANLVNKHLNYHYQLKNPWGNLSMLNNEEILKESGNWENLPFFTIFRGFKTILGHFVYFMLQVWNSTQLSFIEKQVFLDIEPLPNMAEFKMAAISKWLPWKVTSDHFLLIITHNMTQDHCI